MVVVVLPMLGHELALQLDQQVEQVRRLMVVVAVTVQVEHRRMDVLVRAEP